MTKMNGTELRCNRNWLTSFFSLSSEKNAAAKQKKTRHQKCIRWNICVLIIFQCRLWWWLWNNIYSPNVNVWMKQKKKLTRTICTAAKQNDTNKRRRTERKRKREISVKNAYFGLNFGVTLDIHSQFVIYKINGGFNSDSCLYPLCLMLAYLLDWCWFVMRQNTYHTRRFIVKSYALNS